MNALDAYKKSREQSDGNAYTVLMTDRIKAGKDTLFNDIMSFGKTAMGDNPFSGYYKQGYKTPDDYNAASNYLLSSIDSLKGFKDRLNKNRAAYERVYGADTVKQQEKNLNDLLSAYNSQDLWDSIEGRRDAFAQYENADKYETLNDMTAARGKELDKRIAEAQEKYDNANSTLEQYKWLKERDSIPERETKEKGYRENVQNEKDNLERLKQLKLDWEDTRANYDDEGNPFALKYEGYNYSDIKNALHRLSNKTSLTDSEKRELAWLKDGNNRYGFATTEELEKELESRKTLSEPARKKYDDAYSLYFADDSKENYEAYKEEAEKEESLTSLEAKTSTLQNYLNKRKADEKLKETEQAVHDEYMPLLDDPEFVKHTERSFDNVPFIYVGGATNANSAVAQGDDQYVRRNLSSDELKILYGLYNTKGPSAAQEFLDKFEPVINARNTQKMAEWAQKTTEKYPVAQSIAAVAANLASGVGVIGDIANKIQGKEIDPNSPANILSNYASAVRGTTSQMLEDELRKNPESFWNTKFALAGRDEDGNYRALGLFAKETAESIIDNLARIAVSKGVGALAGGTTGISEAALKTVDFTLMGSQVATQTIIDAKKRGLSDGKALAMGFTSGAIEAITEVCSIERVLKNPKNFVTTLGKSLVAEGSEEIASNILNRVVDVMLNADQSEVMQEYYQKINQGMSASEASASVIKGIIGDDLSAGLGGALSGIVMSGTSYKLAQSLNKAQTGIDQIKVGRQLKSADSVMTALDEIIKANPNNTEAIEAKAAIEKGEKVSSRKLGKLLMTEESEQFKKAYSVDANEVKEKLEAKGVENADGLSRAIAKAFNEGFDSVKGRERTELTHSTEAMEVFNEYKTAQEAAAESVGRLSLVGSLAGREQLLNYAKEQGKSNSFLKDAADLAEGKSDLESLQELQEAVEAEMADRFLSADTVEEAREVYKELSEGASKDIAKMLDFYLDDRTDAISEQDKLDKIADVSFKKTRDGVAAYIVTDKMVKEAKAKAEAEAAQVTDENAQAADGNEKTANKKEEIIPISLYDANIGSETTAVIDRATAKPAEARTIYANEYINGNRYLAAASYDRAFNKYYEAGKKGMSFSDIKRSSRDIKADSARRIYEAGRRATENESKRQSKYKQTAEYKSRSEARTEANTKAKKKGGVIRSYAVDKKISRLQRQQLRVLDEWARQEGITIRVVESLSEKIKLEGKIVNGLYDGGNVITIALDGKNMLTSTAGHELYHMIKELASEHAEAFRAFVVDHLKEAGEYDSVFGDYERRYKNTYKVDESFKAKIEEEIVADHCFEALTNKNQWEKFAGEHKSIAEKIIDFIREFVAKINNAFDKYFVHDNAYIRDSVIGEVEYMNKIADMLWEGVDEAVENYRSGAVNESGETKYQQSDVDKTSGDNIKYTQGGESNGKLGQTISDEVQGSTFRAGNTEHTFSVDKKERRGRKITVSGRTAEVLSSSEETAEQKRIKQQLKAENGREMYFTTDGTYFLTDSAVFMPADIFEDDGFTLSNRQASFSQDRFNDLVSTYSVKNGGAGSQNYSKGYVTYISPSDFLALTTTNEQHIVEDARNKYYKLDVDALKSERQTPFLRIDLQTGEVTGHEGRHRMALLRDAGIEKVAIAIEADSEAGKYNTQKLNNVNISGQEFGSGKASGTAILDEVIPLSPKYRNEVKEKFVDVDSDIKYSVSDAGMRLTDNTELSSLMRDNADYKAEIERLKGEFVKSKRMGGKGKNALMQADINRIARSIIGEYSSEISFYDLKDMLTTFYEFLANADESSGDYAFIVKTANDIAKSVIAQSFTDITPEEFADYKKALRSYRLIPNLQDVAELKDMFGTFGAAYRQYGKKLNMRAKGTENAFYIDDVWDDLCEAVPLLDRNADSTQEMWRNLIEVRDSLDERTGFNPYLEDGELSAGQAAALLGADILERFNEVSPDTTFADRAQQRVDLREQKISDLKAEKQEALSKLREQRDARILELKESFRQQNEKRRERNAQTIDRRKIRRLIKRFKNIYNHGSKDRNVKAEMRKTVEKVLESANFLFADEKTGYDILSEITPSSVENKEQRAALKELQRLYDGYLTAQSKLEKAKQSQESGERSEELLNRISEYEKLVEKQRAKLYSLSRSDALSGILAEKRAAANRQTLGKALQGLYDAYCELKNSGLGYIRNAYNDVVAEKLKSIAEELSDKSIRSMNEAELSQLYDAYKMVYHTMTTQNKLFKSGKKQTVEQAALTAMEEMKEATRKSNLPDFRHPLSQKALSGKRSFEWSMMTPYTAFQKTGSKEFTQMYFDFIRGQDTYARDIAEAKETLSRMRKKYGYDDWNLDKAKTFNLESGQKFTATLSELMSAYAISRREQGRKHIENGGFVFSDNKKGFFAEVKTDEKDGEKKKRVVRTAKEAYRLTENDMNRMFGISEEGLDNGPKGEYNKNNGKRGYGYESTAEFRRIQAESQRMSEKTEKMFHSGDRTLDDGLRRRLSRGIRSVLVDSRNNVAGNGDGLLNLYAKGNEFNIYTGVDGKLFHDTFEIVRKYLKYGELVDLHDVKTTEDGIGYDDCYNYLSDDGLSGFSITPNGDLISVFNASNKRGFLRSISDIVKQKVKTLDCYASPNQNLEKIYSDIFGFKTAAIMDYNMEFDHDDIAKNHDSPDVAFMVNTDTDVETKRFGEKQYDDAVEYQQGLVQNKKALVKQLQKDEGGLTDKQRRFVEDLQDYLTKIGEKGNEVSRQLYGIDIFKEKVYFPLESDRDFLNMSSEQGQETLLKNSGMTKETVKNAKNPIVLRGFEDVWSGHINKMALYHGFVLPIENLNRVLSFTPYLEEDTSRSVKTTLKNIFGEESVKYFEDFSRDLNGGTVRKAALYELPIRLIARFKKTAVAANLSVEIQQATAIVRAMAEIDGKYFANTPAAKENKSISRFKEIQKYAPIAIIKEMGGFDTGSGRAATDFILAREYEGKDKIKGFFTDRYYRDELFMLGAAKADEFGWSRIWDAIKREIADTTDLEFNSKEFLEKCGERFTEVIVKTQVYDSTLSRSAMMRSDSEIMKMATAFMGEPTTSVNMLYRASIDIRRGEAGAIRRFARVTAAVYGSIILGAVFKSLVGAGRDDDDDESFWDKYLQALARNLAGDLNPLTMLPFVKDIVEIIDGNDVTRQDLEVVTSFFDACEALSNEDMSLYRKLESFVGGLCNFAGLPVKNIMRDIRGIYNTVNSLGRPSTTTGQEVVSEFVSNIPIAGKASAAKAKQASKITAKYEKAYKAKDLTTMKKLISDEIEAEREKLLDKGADPYELTGTKGKRKNKVNSDARGKVRAKFTEEFKTRYVEAFDNKEVNTVAEIKSILSLTGLYDDLNGTLESWRKEAKEKKKQEKRAEERKNSK